MELVDHVGEPLEEERLAAAERHLEHAPSRRALEQIDEVRPRQEARRARIAVAERARHVARRQQPDLEAARRAPGERARALTGDEDVEPAVAGEAHEGAVEGRPLHAAHHTRRVACVSG
jgi:hypothetical protein